MDITFSASALADLENINAYYQELDAPAVGEEFVASIFAHIETLRDHPDIGRVVPEFGEAHIRELIHPPFRVVYLRGLHSAQVVRVWRSERLLDLNEVNEPLATYS